MKQTSLIFVTFLVAVVVQWDDWIEAATAYFFLLIPVFWLTNYGPVLVKATAVDQEGPREILQNFFDFFCNTRFFKSLHVECVVVHTSWYKLEIICSTNLNVFKNFSQNIPLFWLASKTNSI